MGMTSSGLKKKKLLKMICKKKNGFKKKWEKPAIYESMEKFDYRKIEIKKCND